MAEGTVHSGPREPTEVQRDLEGLGRFAKRHYGALRVWREAPLNVRWPEFGASGRAERDDTASMQKAVDRIRDSGHVGFGGEIYVPPGQYIVNGEVLVPAGLGIKLFGGGCGWGYSGGPRDRARITRLRRTTGYTDNTKAMIRCDAEGAERPNLHLEGMMLDGRATGGVIAGAPLLHAVKTNQLILRDLVFEDHTPVAVAGYQDCGVAIVQPFNGTIENVWFHNLGRIPAGGEIAGAGSGVVINDSGNTLKVTDCEWEGNKGTDLFIGGGVPVVSGIQLTNLKFERGQTNNPSAMPYVWLDACQAVGFSQVFMPAFRQVPSIKQTSLSSIPNTWDGLFLTQTADLTYAEADYFIDIQSGSAIFERTYISSPAGQEPVAYIRLGANAKDFSFDGMVDDPSILVEDNRV